MFDANEYIRFLNENSDLALHSKKYNFECYKDHLLLTVNEMKKHTDDSTLIIAACLHDLLEKVQQDNVNARMECDNVEYQVICEMEKFITPDDLRFEQIKGLVLCCKVPNVGIGEDDYFAFIKKSCMRILNKHEVKVKVNDEFIDKVLLLHECDKKATIRDKECNSLKLSDEEYCNIENYIIAIK